MSDNELFPLEPLERPRRMRQSRPKDLRTRFYLTFTGFVLNLLRENGPQSSSKMISTIELNLRSIRSPYGRLYCPEGISQVLVKLFKEHPNVFMKRNRKWFVNEEEVGVFLQGQVGEFKRKQRKVRKASTQWYRSLYTHEEVKVILSCLDQYYAYFSSKEFLAKYLRPENLLRLLQGTTESIVRRTDPDLLSGLIESFLFYERIIKPDLYKKKVSKNNAALGRLDECIEKVERLLKS